MQKTESISKLAIALVKAQSELHKVAKSANNPFFKSKYADLATIIDAVKPILNNNGIVFLQLVDTNADGSTAVETMLLHESGESISGRTPVVVAKQNDPQALGSAITYAKRYGLQALVGVATKDEDDDGEAAMGRPKAAPQSFQPRHIVAPSKAPAKNDLSYLDSF